MRTTPPRLVLPPCLPTELLTYILTQQTYPTYLLICRTRSTFLSSLLSAVELPQPLSVPDEELLNNYKIHDQDEVEQEPEQQPQAPEPPETAEEDSIPTKHHLLIPTLLQVLSSRNTRLAFLPTLSHLRTYLSVSPPSSTTFSHEKLAASNPLTARVEEEVGQKKALIAVYGLIAMHKDTSEWSAQGLGNTLSALVAAGKRAGAGIVLAEEREGPVLSGIEDCEAEGKQMEDPNPDAEDGEAGAGKGGDGVEAWGQRLPMLNGSMHRGRVAWSGRTVEVGSVLGRWFRFGEAGQ